MKTYAPMKTPQEYSYRLNTINFGLENIDDEIRGFIGRGEIDQIDFKKNIIPQFVQKKLFNYVNNPDFRFSMLLGGVHPLLLDFSVYHEELSCLINNEMKKSVPDLFVMKMLEGMKKYRQLYKEKQCLLLPELIAYYQTGNNPYSFLSDGRIVSKYGEWMKSFSLLDYRCKVFLEIADYYKNDDKQTTCPTKQTKQPLVQKANFRRIIQYKDEEKLLDRLHRLIDEKGGADVGAVLLNARQKNYITRNPTKKEFESEFELKGSWSAISNYMSDNNVNALDRANRIVIFS